MTHMVCGYPNIEESEEIFKTLSKYSEYLEVQFPFSDPIADWPVIEKANEIALENWITTEKCFGFVEKVGNAGLHSLQKNTPKILIMTYYNIIFNYWIEEFIKKAKSIWVYGFIIPDIPFDEEGGKEIRELCEKYNIVFTEIVSPITSDYRLKEISKLNPELVYAISQNMTTGSKAEFWEDFEKYINNLKKVFNLSPFLKGSTSCNEMERGEGLIASRIKIWVWFWVKTKEDVEKVCNISDFAIIWSEFIKRYNSWKIEELKKYFKEITK